MSLFVVSHSQPLHLPLVGTQVAAGFPSPADDFIEGQIDLNEFLIPHPAATFYMRVSGRSMEQAGIIDGDYVIVDRSIQAKSGDIVVAAVAGEFTLKRLMMQKGQWWLVAENAQFASIPMNEANEATIWGVVIGSFRKQTR